jgi:hypothetical protein
MISVVLNIEESRLASIGLKIPSEHNPEAEERRGEAACQLTKLLLARQAIPSSRLRYFCDPECNIGSGSRLGNFVCSGDAVLKHRHYLPFLRYFLHGPNLPGDVIEQFKQTLADCGQVTSGDIAILANCAKHLVHRYYLKPRESAEEFHKLALECELTSFEARSIRDSIRKMHLKT